MRVKIVSSVLTYPRIGGFLFAVLVITNLAGCAHDFAALSGCARSGEAHFDAVPLASQAEHRRGVSFVPSEPGNCLVYVVRERDVWRKSSKSKATLTLAPTTHAEDARAQRQDHPLHARVAEIRDEIYAAWEIPPGRYRLRAYFSSNQAFIAALPRAGAALAAIELRCEAGEVFFYSVGDRGFFDDVVLNTLDEVSGKALVRETPLRSAGKGTAGASPFYRDCADAQGSRSDASQQK